MSRFGPMSSLRKSGVRFHIASLRKALSDGQHGARYITTLPGQGLLLSCSRIAASSPRDSSLVVAANFPHANLPSRLSRMVGRDDDVLKLSAQLNASRFVTIVGCRRRRQNHRRDSGWASPDRSILRRRAVRRSGNAR